MWFNLSPLPEKNSVTAYYIMLNAKLSINQRSDHDYLTKNRFALKGYSAHKHCFIMPSWHKCLYFNINNGLEICLISVIKNWSSFWALWPTTVSTFFYVIQCFYSWNKRILCPFKCIISNLIIYITFTFDHLHDHVYMYFPAVASILV